MIYVIGIVEMCERFAYYGTTAVCMYDYICTRKACTDLRIVVNFIQQPLPDSGPFPSAGAAGTGGQAGALGMGQQASTGTRPEMQSAILR
jgi:POT family proton-dependent oligopeptide transporter